MEEGSIAGRASLKVGLIQGGEGLVGERESKHRGCGLSFMEAIPVK